MVVNHINSNNVIQFTFGTPNANNYGNSSGLPVSNTDPYSVASGGAGPINLRSVFTATYPYITGPVITEMTLQGNIGGVNTGTYALRTGSWPANSRVTLIVPAMNGGNVGAGFPANGVIAGTGGNGQYGNCGNTDYCSQYGAPPGGPCIILDYDLTIINNGTIGSGGNGGQGNCMNRDNRRSYGGGGGAGIRAGIAAQGTSGTYLFGGRGALGDPGNLGQVGYCSLATVAIVMNRNGYNYNLVGNALLGRIV